MIKLECRRLFENKYKERPDSGSGKRSMRKRPNINGYLTAWSTGFKVMRALEGRPCDKNGAVF